MKQYYQNRQKIKSKDRYKIKYNNIKESNDIKKFKILMEYLNKYDSDDIENINLKDCDYNLFSDFNNLISVYKPIKNRIIL